MNFPRFVMNRLVQLLPVLFGIVLIVFMFVRMIPGDPASIMLGTYATPEASGSPARRPRASTSRSGPSSPSSWGTSSRGSSARRWSIAGRSWRSSSSGCRRRHSSPLYAVVLSLLICVPLAVTCGAARQRRRRPGDPLDHDADTGHADLLARPQSPDPLRGRHSALSGRRIWCDALASGSGISSCRRSRSRSTSRRSLMRTLRGDDHRGDAGAACRIRAHQGPAARAC